MNTAKPTSVLEKVKKHRAGATLRKPWKLSHSFLFGATDSNFSAVSIEGMERGSTRGKNASLFS